MKTSFLLKFNKFNLNKIRVFLFYIFTFQVLSISFSNEIGKISIHVSGISLVMLRCFSCIRNYFTPFCAFFSNGWQRYFLIYFFRTSHYGYVKVVSIGQRKLSFFNYYRSIFFLHFQHKKNIQEFHGILWHFYFR